MTSTEPSGPPEEPGPSDITSGSFKLVWLFSLMISVGATAAVFSYVNFTRGHDWLPLGYDSYYYLGYIAQVINTGPINFAASQHYIDFLYPILASIPVHLGASSNVVEVIFPVVLACVTVASMGFLALESGDGRIAILTLAFSSGWFAIYRMGVDFEANLLALPLLILASIFLVRASGGRTSSTITVGAFVILVGLAAAAHVQTTDFFILAWTVGLLYRGLVGLSSTKLSLFMIIGGALVASPFTFALLQDVSSGGLGAQYCAYPPYWLEVLGPGALIVIIGLGSVIWMCSMGYSRDSLAYFLLSWSTLAVAIGVLGYLTEFPIVLSDRSLLLLPVPIISAFGTLWIVDHVSYLKDRSQAAVLLILVVTIPILMVPVVFTYTAPHFKYFVEHGASLVSCTSN